MNKKEKLYKNIPENSGVYLMRGKRGKVLYIGKAGNLKKRVKSYFTRPHDKRIERLVGEIKRIDYKETDSVLEALILEAEFIKKLQPPYNVREKDDKSFLYIRITNDEFPRVLLVRGKDKTGIRGYYGPFTYASEARQALRILRKIFPFSIHSVDKVGKFKRPCLDYEIGLCPGTCIGVISNHVYKENISGLRDVLRGNKKRLIKSLEKKMKTASEKQNFERAQKIKRQIFALHHIQDTALIAGHSPTNLLGVRSEAAKAGPLPSSQVVGSLALRKRTEGYDVSNISGTSAVGAMVVFAGSEPDKSQYRKFKINTIHQQDDTGMIREMLERRFKHSDWPLPDLILVDGGKGQINVAKRVVDEQGLSIPVVGIAKGPKRKKNEFFGKIPNWTNEKTLIKVRDETHRFAIRFHRHLRDQLF